MIQDISIYRVILGAISIFFLIERSLFYIRKENRKSFLKLLATIIIWGSIFIFSFFPTVAHMISQKLGLGENLNTLIFSGFVFVFVIIFKILNKIEKLEFNISKIVREEALEELNNLNKKL